jgi:hypothetical protein
MKPLSHWNAPLRVPHVVALGLLLVLSMLVWFSAILPRLDAALGPLQEGSPFAYEVLWSAIAFLMLPGACILPFIALYCYQRWWDRMRSQPGASPNGGPATPPGSSGIAEGPPSVS